MRRNKVTRMMPPAQLGYFTKQSMPRHLSAPHQHNQLTWNPAVTIKSSEKMWECNMTSKKLYSSLILREFISLNSCTVWVGTMRGCC